MYVGHLFLKQFQAILGDSAEILDRVVFFAFPYKFSMKQIFVFIYSLLQLYIIVFSYMSKFFFSLPYLVAVPLQFCNIGF